MAKQLLLISFLLFTAFCGKAQVNAIPFSQSLDTFQTIAGTVLDMPNEDDVFHADLPLGFNFTYNGQVTSKFGVCTNGYIIMDSLSHGPNWIFGTSSLNQINVMMGDLYNENTGGTLEYLTLGTAPNRVCIIQWKDYVRCLLNPRTGNAQPLLSAWDKQGARKTITYFVAHSKGSGFPNQTNNFMQRISIAQVDCFSNETCIRLSFFFLLLLA